MEKELKKTYKCRKLMDGVYGITSSAVACFLVIGKEKACVVDTAYGFADLKTYIREFTDLPLIVFNTHGHIDYTGGNFWFNAPVHIHEKDAPIYKQHNEPSFHRYMEKSLKVLNKLFFWRILVPKHPEDTDEGRMSFSDWQFVREGDTFDLGDLTVQVIEIPGHTQGSIAIYFKEKKLMITSDGANPATWLYLPESTDTAAYAASLHKLEKYDFETILTGHSLQLFGRKDLKDWIHVAEHPGFSHGKKQKGGAFAPGVTPLQVWAEEDTKHKGPSIVIDPVKEGLRR